jgi:hypothetical protein
MRKGGTRKGGTRDARHRQSCSAKPLCCRESLSHLRHDFRNDFAGCSPSNDDVANATRLARCVRPLAKLGRPLSAGGQRENSRQATDTARPCDFYLSMLGASSPMTTTPTSPRRRPRASPARRRSRARSEHGPSTRFGGGGRNRRRGTRRGRRPVEHRKTTRAAGAASHEVWGWWARAQARGSEPSTRPVKRRTTTRRRGGSHRPKLALSSKPGAYPGRARG